MHLPNMFCKQTYCRMPTNKPDKCFFFPYRHFSGPTQCAVKARRPKEKPYKFSICHLIQDQMYDDG